MLTIEVKREYDGRWIAAMTAVLVYWSMERPMPRRAGVPPLQRR
jgi:hypothetical protein